MILDTNVGINANKAVQASNISDSEARVSLLCVELIQQVIQDESLVIDNLNEIFDEYRKYLSLKGQPGLGDALVKWINDNWAKLQQRGNISIIHKNGNEYLEFPDDSDLSSFDPADRKFIVTCLCHKDKPVIVQSADYKWENYVAQLNRHGVRLRFIKATE